MTENSLLPGDRTSRFSTRRLENGDTPMSGYTTLKGCNPQQKGDFGGDALVLFLRGEAGVGRIGDELKMLFSLALKVKYLEDTMFSPQDRASGSHTSADLWLPFFLSSRDGKAGTGLDAWPLNVRVC